MAYVKKRSLRNIKKSRISAYRRKKQRGKKSRKRKIAQAKTKRLGIVGQNSHNTTLKDRCAPSLHNKKYTCYNDESLHKLKSAWNLRHPDNAITTNDSKEIWSLLKEHLRDLCSSERCWLNQQFVKAHLDEELLSYTFAPTSPSNWKINPNEWLTSTDINKVMKQYEKTYPCFAFIGPSPIDFDHKKSHGSCVWEDLCRFNLQNYISKGVNKIGIIFNLDPHYKDGSHWVSMFVNLKRKFIFYFDSNGDDVPKQVLDLAERIQHQGREIGIELTFSKNHPFEHQKGNTECGIYALYFITNLLKDNHTPEYYKTHKITDEDMEQFRKIFFN